MKKSLALVGLLAIAGLGLGVLSGCHKDDVVDPDPTIVDDDGPEESDHDWVETSHVDATCTEAGSVTYTCSVCGETETLEVPALGHEWENALYVEASEEPQVAAHWERECERCDAVETVDLSDLPTGTVLEPTKESQLDELLAVDGATIAIGATYDEETQTFNPFTVSSGFAVGENVSITLELGEDAILTGTDGNSATSQEGTTHPGLITVAEGGSLVIKADDTSSIVQTNAAHAVLNVAEGGTCVIEGGHFEVTNSSTYTIVNDGDLTITGGTFSTTNAGSTLVINGDDHASGGAGSDENVHVHSLTINGGEFLGGKHVIKNCLGGQLTINEGNFDGFILDEEGHDTPSDDIIDNELGTTVINGGVFGESLVWDDSYGGYTHTFAVKDGVVAEGETQAKESSITINGGTIYPGTGAQTSAYQCASCSGYFAFGDARAEKNEPATMADQVIITSAEVWSSMSSAISSDENIHVEGETVPVTLVAASAYSASQSN